MTTVSDNAAQIAQGAITRASATSSAAAVPGPSRGSAHSPDDDSTVVPQRGGPPSSSNGGGGGGSNSGNSQNMKKYKTYLWLIVIGIIFFLASMFTQDWIQQRWLVNKREMLLLEKEEFLIREEMKRLSVPSTQSLTKSVVSQPVTHQSFSCETVEAMKSGFARASTQVVANNALEHRFTSGCTLVQVDFFIKSLRGRGYVFQEVIEGRIDGCGDINGVDFTPRQCADFLNSRRGQIMQLVIKNGGSVILN